MTVNPYDTQTIAGYNSAPPPDDGSKSSDNKVEWSKHKEKIGDPLKNLAEGINSEALSAFGDLIMTTDPGEETVIVAMRTFGGMQWR